MRISDWSSDVCSSDLPLGRLGGIHLGHRGLAGDTVGTAVLGPGGAVDQQGRGVDLGRHVGDLGLGELVIGELLVEHLAQIGRASCRERVCQYVKISVVAESLKKKKHNKQTRRN